MTDARREQGQLRDNAQNCPACHADLQGAPIPAESQQAYGATHFSRVIGIYSREQDRTTTWRCPDCGHTWDRERKNVIDLRSRA